MNTIKVMKRRSMGASTMWGNSCVPGIKKGGAKCFDDLDWVEMLNEYNRLLASNKRKLTMIALCVGIALGKKLKGPDFI